VLGLELGGEALTAGEHAEQRLARLDAPHARLAVHGVDRYAISGTNTQAIPHRLR
jgi:hypothetical protein